MKFDFVIGNPPYQDNTIGDNATYAPPIYNMFMEASYSVSDKVELIHPARFLFNAGSTPKDWNKKMLNDEHFIILFYEQDSSKVFSNTDIKGGVVVSYRDNTQVYGAIETFTPFLELNSIIKKVTKSNGFATIMDIIYIQNRYDLEKLYADKPECKSLVGSNGKDSRFEKNSFAKMPVFSKEDSIDSIRTIGVFENKRTWRFISTKYVDKNHENLNKYKVVMPVANGSGEFGQILSSPFVAKPQEAYTRSFIGIGAFDELSSAEALLKYLKSKFARAMLCVLKVTQMNNKDVWKYVPLQDFTPTSDIDWSKPVAEIDQQLYKKYDLTPDEIKFIETHVKEME